MARYDAGWGRTPSDQAFATRRDRGWGGSPGGGPGGARGGRMGGYDEDLSRGADGGGRGGGVYGPARYGLGPYHERLRQRQRSDDELRAEVEEALFYDTWVDADAISVEVNDGIVTLRGELPDYEEIRYAVDDAWDVDGVRGVRSELTVRSERASARG